MTLLRWVPAEREDRDALRTFGCTPPREKVRRNGRWEPEHPAKHELAVQSMIRKRLAPVGEPRRTVLLGWEGVQLGGVSSYRALGSGAYNLDVIAIATRFRRRGRGWALEALSVTLDFLSADAHADGYSGATVAAQIHERNRPSQLLFEGQGFQPTAILADGYQVWSADLLIAGAADFDR